MRCFWFGHALPRTEQAMLAAIEQPQFKCSRCGKMASWDDQPKRVKKLRDEAVALRKQQIN